MRLNYQKYSESGAPLLVLHGLFGSLGNWGWHSKELSQHHSVIGVDLRNHGNSPHDAELSYPAMASDVLQLIEDLGFASVAIIGHSMGGKVAMELALQHHRVVDRLIVVDIAPVGYPEDTQTHQRAIAGMKALNLVGLKTRDEAETFLEDYIEEEATRKFILTNLARDEGGGFRWRLNLEAIEKNKKYKTTVLCEPQMGKRGLYPALSTKGLDKEVQLMMDFISFCDGKVSLFEIAENLNLPIWELYGLVEKLESHGLISVKE